MYSQMQYITELREAGPMNGIKGNSSGGTEGGRGNKAAEDDGDARERK
jgi:hypothetical protein